MLTQDSKMLAENLKLSEILTTVNGYLATVTSRREYVSFLALLIMGIELKFETALMDPSNNLTSVFQDSAQLSEKLKEAHATLFDSDFFDIYSTQYDWDIVQASSDVIKSICLGFDANSYESFFFLSLRRRLLDLLEGELRKSY